MIGTDSNAPYSYLWTEVPVGNYSLTAKATDNTGLVTTSMPVSVQVTSEAPSVNLTVPVQNQKFGAPSNILLAADASDSDGSISKVEFYSGTTLIGTVNEAPYSYLWTNVSAGSYALSAKATDNFGASTISAPVNIVVTNNSKPTVSVTATPATATAPAVIGISAIASDTDGTIARVDFYNGEEYIGTAKQEPYTFNWRVISAGEYSITAKATDDLGESTVSAAVNVQVAAGNDEFQVFYIQTDHLNTPRVITDSSNTQIWQWENSDPFGSNVPMVSGGFEFNLRYPGQYFDSETNLHYNYFRDYDPEGGRYIQSGAA